MQIILGSQSPRRRELMAGLDLPFTAITIDADETYPAELQAGDIPYYISRVKARAYESQLTDDQLLITADTIVWLEGRMLGKPHNEAEALAMLKQLRNKTHQVYTAVTLAQKGTLCTHVQAFGQSRCVRCAGMDRIRGVHRDERFVLQCDGLSRSPRLSSIKKTRFLTAFFITLSPHKSSTAYRLSS